MGNVILLISVDDCYVTSDRKMSFQLNNLMIWCNYVDFLLSWKCLFRLSYFTCLGVFSKRLKYLGSKLITVSNTSMHPKYSDVYSSVHINESKVIWGNNFVDFLGKSRGKPNTNFRIPIPRAFTWAYQIFYLDQLNSWHKTKHDFEPFIWPIGKKFCFWEFMKFFFTKYLHLDTSFESAFENSFSTYVLVRTVYFGWICRCTV